MFYSKHQKYAASEQLDFEVHCTLEWDQIQIKEMSLCYFWMNGLMDIGELRAL